MFARVLALFLLFVPFAATAEVFDDGGDHVLDWTTIEMVEVVDATRLEFVDGGPGATLAGEIEIRGGSFVGGDGNQSGGTATVEIHGGSFDSRFVVIGEGSQILVHGSEFTTDGSANVIGTLADGTPISVGVWTLDGGEVTLVESVATESTTFGDLKARY